MSQYRRTEIILAGILGLWAAVGMGVASAQEAPPADAAALEFFEKSVRPILVSRCFECHSDKLKEPKGGLRLDSRAGALKGGDTSAAIVPHKPKESLLVDAVNYGETYQMPPKSKLPPEEIAALTKWVEMGAPWPKEAAAATANSGQIFDLAARKASHWCWQPIAPQTPPAVKNGAWVQAPLDAFILAKLEAKGIAPNGPAEKRVLLRRAYFDLVGLPPTPEQVEAFVKDSSPGAFAKVVDELLKSPHFGERWGRHWLDLVRYAESRGHEFDYDIPNVWHYRDYVIRALNADVPYDQFVTEHIAGDLLEKPRLHPEEGFNEAVLGTGFWHLGEWIHSPVDIRKDECDRFDNMVDVFSKTFLGLTVSCARCHDHKFDAIAQADYYALFGYLQSSDYRQVRFDADHVNRPIAEKLAQLDAAARAKTLATYRDATAPLLAKLPEYLLAAHAARSTDGGAIKPEAIRSVAETAKVDADLLAAWLTQLEKARTQADDLLRPLALVLLAPEAADAGKMRAAIAEVKKLAGELESQRAESAKKGRVIVDYSQPGAGDWMADGLAFGLGATRTAELVLRTDGQMPFVVDVVKRGGAERDARFEKLSRTPGTQTESGNLSRWEGAGQTLRTPTFDVTDDQVHFLVQGAGRALAVIDSHRLIAGPLHNSAMLEWDNAVGPRWVSQNVGAYRGHRMHIEFSPRGDNDLRVLMVVSGQPINPATGSPVEAVAAIMDDEAQKDLANLCHKYAVTLKSALADKTADPENAARWRQWVIEHSELLMLPTEREALQKSLAQLAGDYQRDGEPLVAQIKRASRTAPAMWDGSGENERLLIRGNHTTPKDPVSRHFLTAIAGAEAPKYERGSGRLDLAGQVVDPNNPLTARVMANRIWHHLLGRGIVPTTDNFGVLGQTPSHPELLDYLATEFRREGWSVKRLVRTIMLSSTYQMSSTPGAADAEVDPQNLLWHRANIRRLEAEVIRDQMLALGGKLSDKMYGPSVPVFLTPYMQGRGRPSGGPLDGDGRRSIYISIRRNFLSPMMLAFDAPSPFSTMGKRNVSNVPAQALTLMNDPLVIEQAKLWAKRLLADAKLSQSPERITRLYQEAFAREPSAEEAAAALAFLEQQAASYKLPAAEGQTDERAWADLCHVLMNVKEFIFIP